MKGDNLLPVQSCMVSTKRYEMGVVLKVMHGIDGATACIHWVKENKQTNVAIDKLFSGFKVGMEVSHICSKVGWSSLGLGVILRTRKIANSQQLLVEFRENGERRWLPFQTLKWIKGAKHRYAVGEVGDADSVEKFRLRILANAIENWHENTGALSKLDIDPLPHQVHLVHHIINSGNLNWLIADDVGLGKTIETGMLISALKQRNMAQRILLITPAGLTRQWQEEMHYKFGLDGFRIYGEQFSIDESREWKMYDHVIASIDRLKDENHLELIRQSSSWDLIIFDEAHRLSRRQYGMKYDSSQRFQLAQVLRPLAKAMILLTATPHQGMLDKFQSLLMLLRPEREDEIQTLSLNPKILQDMVYRNNKSDVTDAEGNFIFQGKTTRSLIVSVSDEALKFDKALKKYLREGYQAGKSLGYKGNAIGFVMTVYRKLSTSSSAAILTALERRREKLIDGDVEVEIDAIVDLDNRYQGEAEEQLSTQSEEFFEGELYLLDELLLKCKRYNENDQKLKQFIENLIPKILGNNEFEKVLIFSEYRSTQEHIRKALAEKYGEDRVSLINGSMDQYSRREAIFHFENDGQFLVSTEAGGEGINLQRECHIMINFDLPWNPMRLVQRIGRLYRYGQKKHVVVFNIQSPNTLDDQIIQLMYERIDQVVCDLATVGSEFDERLHDDILGEIADLIDVENILIEALDSGIDRTTDRVDEAIKRAKETLSKQQDLFEYAEGFDPDRLLGKLIIDSQHIYSFVEGMFLLLNVEIVNRSHKGDVWSIRLSDLLMEDMGVGKSRWKITLNKTIASLIKDIELLDAEHFLLSYLLEKAKSYDFGGQTASIEIGNLNDIKMLSAGYLSWQDEMGLRRNREFCLWGMEINGAISQNNPAWLDLLKSKQEFVETNIDRRLHQEELSQLELFLEKRLEVESHGVQIPESSEIIVIAKIST